MQRRRVFMTGCVFWMMLLSACVPISGTFTPNDDEWPQWGPNHIQAGDAWDLSGANTPGNDDGFTNPGKREIVVAVLDNGCDMDHPDLEDNIWEDVAKDFSGVDDYDVDVETLDHGTIVAGIIAAVTHNEEGIAGIAQIRLMILKLFTDSDDRLTPQDWADAIEYASDNGADVICICTRFREDWKPNEGVITSKIDDAWNDGVITVKSMDNWVKEVDDGKRGGSHNGVIDLPELVYSTPVTNHVNVIAVGATTDDDTRLMNSFIGTVDVMAPGDDIMTTIHGGYDYFSGTSVATPHVAGLAALLMSYNPELSPAEIRWMIESTCDDIINAPPGDPLNEIGQGFVTIGKDASTGWGLISAEKALSLATRMKREWSHPRQQMDIRVDPNIMDNFEADVDKDGFTHMVSIILDAAPKQVYYKRIAPSGSISVNEMKISDQNTHCDYPDIYVDFENNVHIVWKYTHYDAGGDWSELWYKKYNSDMSQTLRNQRIANKLGTLNYNSPEVVVDMSRNAYIFYDEFNDQQNECDLIYTIVDQNGNTPQGAPYTWVSTGYDEGEPFRYDVDLSYASSVERIHVVWQEDGGGDDDIIYQSMDTNGVRTPVPALDIAVTANQERHPSLDSQFNDGYVHVVFEDWGSHSTSREDQIIRYCVIDPQGNFVRVVDHGTGDYVAGPVQIGAHTTHADPINFPLARDGKFYPTVSFANNNIVTIAWKEWVDDHSQGDGYYSVYYTQRTLNHEEFYAGAHPLTAPRVIPDREIVLVNDINDLHPDAHEHVVVVASDNRASSSDYNMDGHIRILYQQRTGIWDFKLTMVETRELWNDIQNIGFIENTERLDPDVYIDEYDDWHMVYTQRDQINVEEVYYRREWIGNPVPISVLDGFRSYSPKVLTRTETRLGEPHEIAYIFWIDEVALVPEIYYAAVSMAWPNPHYVFPTPNGPTRAPFQPLLPLYDVLEFDIALQNIPGGNLGVIHALYTLYDSTTQSTSIAHGSVYVGPILPSGTRFHGVNEITNGWGGFCEPAIDIGPDDRPYIVYVDTVAVRQVIYDVLEQNSNPPWFWMSMNNPTVVNAVAHGYDPDIKVDRGIQRRANTDDVLQPENRFVHIVWFHGPWAGPYQIAYSKWHPIDANVDEPTEPEIALRIIEPPGYAAPMEIGELSLEISPNNNLAIIYSARTMGYKAEAQNILHQFCVFIDNNGVITSTNVQVSDNNVNNEHVLHSSGGFTLNDELVCAWDMRTMVGAMNYHQTIWWRTYFWR